MGEQFTYPPADLEQAQPQGVELQRRVALRAEPAAQRVEQPVGGHVQEQAELVGPEAAVAQAVGEAGAFEEAIRQPETKDERRIGNDEIA